MNNKVRNVTIFSLCAIVLTLIFFALPGQFASLIPDGKAYTGAMGGYQFIFGGSSEALRLQTLSTDSSLVSAHGIAFLVLLVLAVVCYVLSKKSTALLLLGGIVLLVAAILLFCAKGWIDKLYTKYPESSVAGWTAYLSASLLMLAALGTLVVSIMELVKESRQPYQPKKETYSYLKNK